MSRYYSTAHIHISLFKPQDNHHLEHEETKVWMRNGFKVTGDSNSDTDLASGSHPHSESSLFPLCLPLTGEVLSAKWAFLGVWGAPQKGHIWTGSPGGIFTGHRGASGSPLFVTGQVAACWWPLISRPISCGAAFEHLEEMVWVPLGGTVGEIGGRAAPQQRAAGDREGRWD